MEESSLKRDLFREGLKRQTKQRRGVPFLSTNPPAPQAFSKIKFFGWTPQQLVKDSFTQVAALTQNKLDTFRQFLIDRQHSAMSEPMSPTSQIQLQSSGVRDVRYQIPDEGADL